MTPARTRQRYNTIQRHLDNWKEELVRLQAKCAHSNADGTYMSSTGNYDPSANSYWIAYHCPDCGKVWNEDQ